MKTRLPDELIAQLPDTDKKAPVFALDGGGWIIAGKHALIVCDERAIVNSGMWWEIQYASLDAESRLLMVQWADPQRRPLVVKLVDEKPAKFMSAVTESVNHSMVVSKSVRAANGTTITATIRRRDDDQLFSTVAADGDLDAEGERLANRLEAEVREGVGLE